MSWICPMCSTENNDTLLKCYCGYEFDVNKEEQKNHFQSMSTDLLIEIYTKKDFRRYDQDSFNLIKSILIQRGEWDKIVQSNAIDNSNTNTVRYPHSHHKDKAKTNVFMKQIGIFLVTFVIISIISIFITFLGIKSEKRDYFQYEGEGLFNLGINDIPIVYGYEGQVYMAFIDGNKYIVTLQKQYNEATSLEKFNKMKVEMNKVKDLNDQARGKGVIILLLINIFITFVAYKLINGVMQERAAKKYLKN